MKKYQLFSFAIVLFTFLQSCTITSENTFHKDATTSMLMTINMKEAMGLVKGMGEADSPNSAVKFPKYSKNWESLYDSEKKKALENGEKFAPAEDTARVMKKVFTKMNVDKSGEMEGFSLKYDRLTNAELLTLSAKKTNANVPMSSSNFGAWDGKTMVLDLTKINADELMKNDQLPAGGDKEKDNAGMKNMAKMFKMTFLNTIKFDKKIKTIKGKHDWVTQKDGHTLLLSVDLGELADDHLKLKNKDSKITITTE